MNSFDLTLPRQITKEAYEAERHRRLPPHELEPRGIYVCCMQLVRTRIRTKEVHVAYPARVFKVSGQLIHFATLNEAYDQYTQVYEEPFPGGLWDPKFTKRADYRPVEGYMADMALFDGFDAITNGVSIELGQ